MCVYMFTHMYVNQLIGEYKTKTELLSVILPSTLVWLMFNSIRKMNLQPSGHLSQENEGSITVVNSTGSGARLGLTLRFHHLLCDLRAIT